MIRQFAIMMDCCHWTGHIRHTINPSLSTSNEHAGQMCYTNMFRTHYRTCICSWFIAGQLIFCICTMPFLKFYDQCTVHDSHYTLPNCSCNVFRSWAFTLLYLLQYCSLSGDSSEGDFGASPNSARPHSQSGYSESGLRGGSLPLFKMFTPLHTLWV